MTAPDGWTEDMSIVLPPGLDLETLVNTVLEKERQHVAYEEILAELVARGLSTDDAQLAHDRVLGGLVRAATSNGANAPSQADDPIAWLSYRLCRRDPSLIQAIRPETSALEVERPWPKLEPLPPKPPWWAFWK